MSEPALYNQAAADAGIEFAMQTLKQCPRGEAFEYHVTGMLIVFWGALWGSFGTEFARDFIEAQLRGMEDGAPHDTFTEPRVQ